MKEYTIREEERSLTLNFSSALHRVSRAVKDILNFVQKFAEDIPAFNFNLVTREALNNAVIHGNSCNPERQVRVRVSVSENELILVVEDEGPGFNWREICEREFKGFQESGMGMKIMSGNGFELSFNDSGNVLTLRYRMSARTNAQDD